MLRRANTAAVAKTNFFMELSLVMTRLTIQTGA
jgi:hypothetical protein